MEKLEYHLEGFDGPLDLLLSLIAKNKLINVDFRLFFYKILPS